MAVILGSSCESRKHCCGAEIPHPDRDYPKCIGNDNNVKSDLPWARRCISPPTFYFLLPFKFNSRQTTHIILGSELINSSPQLSNEDVDITEIQQHSLSAFGQHRARLAQLRCWLDSSWLWSQDGDFQGSGVSARIPKRVRA